MSLSRSRLCDALIAGLQVLQRLSKIHGKKLLLPLQLWMPMRNAGPRDRVAGHVYIPKRYIIARDTTFANRA